MRRLSRGYARPGIGELPDAPVSSYGISPIPPIRLTGLGWRYPHRGAKEINVKRFGSIVRIAFVVVCALAATPAWTQVMDTEDIVLPATEPTTGDAVTPYFWIGAQAVASAGVDINTGAFGLRNHAGDTWASFNIAFVDSLYATPKAYEVGADDSVWTGHLALRNYTARLNSWEGWTSSVNTPVWLAEVHGHGFRIGVFSQAGQMFAGDNVNVPTTISSGDLVLYLADMDAMAGDYLDLAVVLFQVSGCLKGRPIVGDAVEAVSPDAVLLVIFVW